MCRSFSRTYVNTTPVVRPHLAGERCAHLFSKVTAPARSGPPWETRDGLFDFGNKQALQEGELIIEKMEDMDAEAEQWMWLFIKELQDIMGIGYEDD